MIDNNGNRMTIEEELRVYEHHIAIGGKAFFSYVHFSRLLDLVRTHRYRCKRWRMAVSQIRSSTDDDPQLADINRMVRQILKEHERYDE